MICSGLDDKRCRVVASLVDVVGDPGHLLTQPDDDDDDYHHDRHYHRHHPRHHHYHHHLLTQPPKTGGVLSACCLGGNIPCPSILLKHLCLTLSYIVLHVLHCLTLSYMS